MHTYEHIWMESLPVFVKSPHNNKLWARWLFCMLSNYRTFEYFIESAQMLYTCILCCADLSACPVAQYVACFMKRTIVHDRSQKQKQVHVCVLPPVFWAPSIAINSYCETNIMHSIIVYLSYWLHTTFKQQLLRGVLIFLGMYLNF